MYLITNRVYGYINQDQSKVCESPIKFLVLNRESELLIYITQKQNSLLETV